LMNAKILQKLNKNKKTKAQIILSKRLRVKNLSRKSLCI